MKSDFCFYVIVATDKKGGIGKNNKLPWQGRLATDMAFFKELTTAQYSVNVISRYFDLDVITGHQIADHPSDLKNAVVMGRKTWDSIPNNFKPLEGRINVVISRTVTSLEGAVCCGSLEDALEYLKKESTVGSVYVIGGAQIYAEAFTHPLCRDIYLTSIGKEFYCDTYLNLKDLSTFKCLLESPVIVENGIAYTFKILQK